MKLRIAATCAVTLLVSMATHAADPLAPTGRWTAYTAGAGTLPPMGWNSWNAFASAIDEEKLMGSARQHRRQRPGRQGLSLHQPG